MIFSSTIFIYVFLPIVLFFYYVIFGKNRKLQNVFLFVASLVFYAWGEAFFLVLMLLSIGTCYVAAIQITKAKEMQKEKTAKNYLVMVIFLHLLLLFIFKYLSFVLANVIGIFSIQMAVPVIPLPLGISFFTFQAMSYVFDVYYGKTELQKNILHLGLYIALFPQLVAGPIVRYQTVAHEIVHRKETIEDFSEGFIRFVLGMSKKVLLANAFAYVADMAFNTTAYAKISVSMAWLGMISYTLQIYFDFSGYSDMAIGLGRMFGFHFAENFRYPYISLSITEFWRRWHISLGSWFRDYVYIPLGGSRVSKVKMLRNLLIVWMLTGIWHGANWTFFWWGMLYFLLLTMEKYTGLPKKEKKGITKGCYWIYTLFFVMLGWVLFRSDSMQMAFRYIGYLFHIGNEQIIDGLFFTQVKTLIIYLPIGLLVSAPIYPWIKDRMHNNLLYEILSTIGLICIFLLCLIYIVSNAFNPFIYSNF